jgi:hypothetical protein
MPMMIGHPADMAARAATESIFLQHVVHTLMPWCERIEQSADNNLLTEQEINSGHYTKFTVNALLRGAAKDRADFYAKGLGSGNGKGWLTQNDVRALEEMDRVDDPEADKLPQPPAPAPAPENVKPEVSEEPKAFNVQDLKSAIESMPSPIINVDVKSPEVNITQPNIEVHAHLPNRGKVHRTAQFDETTGRMTGMIEEEVENA